LRNALYPDSNVAQRYPEMGLYGTSLQSEVAADRNADVQERSIEDRVKEAEREAGTRDGREPPAQDKERD
jgi:hypothetical protein